MTKTTRTLRPRRLIAAIVLIVIGGYLVLGATFGTSDHSPFAGTPILYGSAVFGGLTLLGGVALASRAWTKQPLRRTRAPRGVRRN